MNTFTAPRTLPVRTARSAPAAFTLIELLTVIAIIGILAAILIPTVGAVRAKARASQCASNLRQVGMALQLYANDNKDLFPRTGWEGYVNESDRPWMWKIAPYLGMEEGKQLGKKTEGLPKSAGVLVCPVFDGSNADHRIAYGYNLAISDNRWLYRRAAVEAPSRIFLLIEIGNPARGASEGGSFNDAGLDFRHPGDSANALFVDGHVAGVKKNDLIKSTDPRWKWW
ncbi:prepilin-type N-terminal cleavage/methylation domain-containing protein [Opitutaceae bacterium TAV1]|nr:prepilin-type N-terminal cleavage/methylation domain-containing protein [Opitutaceae bacterium TAV1]